MPPVTLPRHVGTVRDDVDTTRIGRIWWVLPTKLCDECPRCWHVVVLEDNEEATNRFFPAVESACRVVVAGAVDPTPPEFGVE
jgi:hypothetical protein